MVTTGRSISQEVNQLANNYRERDKQIDDYYNQLMLEDKMAQRDMESFVSNDPRTLFNMVVYLLRPRPLQITISHNQGGGFTDEETQWARRLEQGYKREWEQIDKTMAPLGRRSFYRSFIGMLVATGWFGVPYSLVDNKPWIGYWHPKTIYPEYIGLTNKVGVLGRKRTITANQARFRAIHEGWSVPTVLNNTVIEYMLYKWDGSAYQHAVSFNDSIVKDWASIGPELPVALGVTAGLPDDGTIDRDYRKRLGESVLATNSNIYDNQNRQYSYLQQMIRDTANPRWFERSADHKPILDPDAIFRRGAIFRGGLNDDVQALGVPPIPVEARSTLFDIHNMVQRGGISDVTFGNIQQQVSSLLVSQSAESAMQLIEPFKDAVEYVAEQATRYWLEQRRLSVKARPAWYTDISQEFLNQIEVTVNYSVKIPGDLQARANLAKFINPQFTVSVDQLFEMFLPEVDDIPAERAAIRADKAEESPEIVMLSMISALQRKAEEASRRGEHDVANLYQSIAKQVIDRVTASLIGPGGLSSNQPQTRGLPPSVMSGTEQARFGGTNRG